MITRFSTFSDAAIFASLRRDEGQFAELLHVNAAHLWGPHPDWGVAVLHSEVTHEDTPPERETVVWLPSELNRAIAILLMMTAAMGVSAVVLSLFGLISAMAGTPTAGVSPILMLLAGLAILPATVVVGHLMIGYFRTPKPSLPQGLCGILAEIVAWIAIFVVWMVA
ncbi:hypothetical protein HAHE_17780 [Haloferula helveola]|uniref:Yip1 domain-containing protein n=1 Tax=Haloferula helveola TaxID=490095 RepID=A0ABM7R9H0_9BACT|nr:hypothetical protein HAHE_17780 [Haloferula helveola]